MYLEHFGLAVNPFGLSPKLDFLYKSETFEESMAHLIFGLDNQEAIVLITGAIGTGKTMALQSFLMNLGPRFEFALITNTRLTSIELMKMILEDLDVKFPIGSDKSDLLILFKDYMLAASNAGKRVLIVVDEAQNLSSEVLEEIRLLTNLGQGEGQPVQIILVGQPELDAKVNSPELAQLRQRIRVHYNLDPLSRKEIEEYLDHRMAVAGCTRRVFNSEAIDVIYRESRGIPRLVNTMAGEALLSAFVAGHDKVHAKDVESDKDLSFETGPATINPPKESRPVVPLPAPPADPISVKAVPRETPELMVPPPGPRQPDIPVSAPPAAREAVPSPRMNIPSRRSNNGAWRVMRGWVVAALMVVAIGTLYFMGYLDGVIAAIYPLDPGESQQTVHQPVEPQDEMAAVAGQAAETERPETLPQQTDPAETESPATIVPEPAEPEAVVTESKPAETGSKESAAIASVGNTYIHISSFRTSERADSLVRRMNDVGPGAVTLNMDVRGEAWYRVYLGPYVSREEAYMDAIRLKQDGTIKYYRLTTIEPDQLD